MGNKQTKTSKINSPSFHLSFDEWFHIFQFLKVSDYPVIMSSCKFFNGILNDDSLWGCILRQQCTNTAQLDYLNRLNVTNKKNTKYGKSIHGKILIRHVI